jgi:hypothetical protein
MHNNLTALRRLLIFSFFLFFLFSNYASAQNFQPFSSAPAMEAGYANPLVKLSGAGCAVNNLRIERFVAELSLDERLKLCRSMEKITSKLNQTAWSPALAAELKNVWQVFSAEPITLRSMPKEMPAQMLAMAEPFPDKTSGNSFAAAVYLRPEKSDDQAFFQILLHELRHVYDFHETWRDKTQLDSLEIERRAFLLMGKLTQETPEREKLSGVPKFWKESWHKKSEAEISAKRLKAIEKYLRGKKLYRDLAHDPNRRTLDYSYLKNTIKTDEQKFVGSYDKQDGERLPVHNPLPPTVEAISQNIRETNFNLEKPKNPRDAKEILRVALSNEKKLYYGMNNFVYDQKLAFQCWRKGKLSGSFTENNTVARTDNGNALVNLTANTAPANLPCVLNYQDLKTDFTHTFFASPALEKMPIYFVGFYEIDGKTLAEYTVLQPNERLFNQLANEYPHIRPFRVIVGTIYISPEDGQIVRFGGTSFPEENVIGRNSQKIWGSHWVTAVRQKLNIDGGLWVTVKERATLKFSTMRLLPKIRVGQRANKIKYRLAA